METSRPTLLWGINCESGQISALPASPFLLPAFLIYCVVWFIGLFVPKKVKKEPIPLDFDEQEYAKNKAMYHYLCDKLQRGEQLTDSEKYTLNCILPRPSWAKPGEWWTY